MKVQTMKGLTGRRAPRRVSPNDADRGLTLMAVLLMVMISSILLAAAVPLWTTVMQREKEAELIFRGEQYVAAIEEFQATVGRPPTKLDELVEFKTFDQKKFIRKLYKDPMTKDGEWELLYAGSEGKRRGRRRMRKPGASSSEEGDEEDATSGEEDESAQVSGPLKSNIRYTMPGRASRQQLHGGFILGVRSKSTDPSIKIYNGAESYDGWEFRARLIQSARAQTGRPGSQPNRSMYESPRDARRRRAIEQQRRQLKGVPQPPRSSPRYNRPR